MNLILHFSKHHTPNQILNQLDFLQCCYDGKEMTLETSSQRFYFYDIPNPLLERAKHVLSTHKGSVKFIITEKYNHCFDESI